MSSSKVLAVDLQAVSYRYPRSNKGALSEISYTFPTGTTAIVGPNGAGKSTLVKLLTGLLTPTRGSIGVQLLDGTCLPPEQADKAALFQEPSHLYLTIRQNVTMRFERTPGEDARIHDALELAGLSGVVEGLPDGIDTLVGAGFGGQLDLSGGQWQRLALARLIYQDASVMILDEPVASLDPEGERAVFELFAQMNRAKIIIFTTHRYDSIPRGTTIVVLVDGRIAEIGTHEELIQRQRQYWSLWTYGRDHDQVPQKRSAHNGRLRSTSHTPRLESGNSLSPPHNSGSDRPQPTSTGDGPAATGGEDHSTRRRCDVYPPGPRATAALSNGNPDGPSANARRSADMQLGEERRQSAAHDLEGNFVSRLGEPVGNPSEVEEAAAPESTPVALALEEIADSLGVIEDECDNYGGWAGEDDEARKAVDLAQRIIGLAWVVAVHGREAAKGGL
jgi:ABC-type multidrug transport system ATPase subunit